MPWGVILEAWEALLLLEGDQRREVAKVKENHRQRSGEKSQRMLHHPHSRPHLWGTLCMVAQVCMALRQGTGVPTMGLWDLVDQEVT